ncbi:MAG: XdhC family protein [Chloracidobacterium sp.]|nr:XdhC family protein [Chloracidobacterium sp.]MCC6825854.1 XdhC family protein [Acidobacteriota bacterium]MCO5334501.1 XdhC family protein [Pyrinomonadaceae bacterium]
MSPQPEFWQFVAARLKDGACVELLVVAVSSGSSPGRAGYKMAVAADGGLCGSIGGGVMEVKLVEQAKATLSEPQCPARGLVIQQVHRKNVPNSSGMICSGRQSVIVKHLTSGDLPTVEGLLARGGANSPAAFEVSNSAFRIVESTDDGEPVCFRQEGEAFVYQEALDRKDRLVIIGGGHCSLALSEIAAGLGFHVSVFDDRPELNTIEKNVFADNVTIISSYDRIAEHIPQGEDVYVAVMTLGYVSDAEVIRKLIDHDVRYFGALGSTAKMAALLKELREEGFDEAKLARIRTPIGIAINSRTPKEIAVSIAAEIISVRNA